MAKTGPNKTREWRKQRRVETADGKVMRVGRYFRNLRMNMPTMKAYPTELMILLMKHANIETPKFDAGMVAMRQKEAELKAAKESEIVDVQPEGASA